MPSWKPNMTKEDHDRNAEDARRQWAHEASLARSYEAHWRQRAEHLEALVAAYGLTAASL